MSSLLFAPPQRGLLFGMPTPATMQANTQSDWTVIRRLLALSWRYRAGCIKVFIYQLILLAMGLAGLGLTGLGIDFVRW
jgi:ATP-binding cassette subfamily B protein